MSRGMIHWNARTSLPERKQSKKPLLKTKIASESERNLFRIHLCAVLRRCSRSISATERTGVALVNELP